MFAHRSLPSLPNPLHGAGPGMVWVVVLIFVFAECSFLVGLFLPGDSLLVTAGIVLSNGEHYLHAWALCIAATAAAVGGNMLGFYIGRRSGRALVTRRGGRVLTPGRLRRAELFLARHGWWAVVVARWIPWVRTLAPLIAGTARMNPRRYFSATSLGALTWMPPLLLLGYYGAGLLDAMPWAKGVLTWAAIGVFVAGTAFGLLRYRHEVRKPARPDGGPEPAAEQRLSGAEPRRSHQ
jgi:membrane-associated protein